MKIRFSIIVLFIMLFLIDGTGFANQKGVEVVSKNNDEQGSFYHKSWAVVIGINNYSNWPTLQYAVSDALAIKKQLEKMGFEKVIVLTNKNATRRRILKTLGEVLKSKVGSHDRVVIYFSGHGQTESLPSGGEKGYLIPVDCSNDAWFSEGISMDQLRTIHERLASKHILYIVDACYSGLGLSKSGGIDPNLEGFYGKLTNKKAVQIITAGGRDELAREENGHGILTHYILNGFSGEADNDNDGIIRGSELGAYVRKSVSLKTKNKQTPQWGSLEGEGDILFIINDKKATRALQSINNYKPRNMENEKIHSLEEQMRRIQNLLKEEIYQKTETNDFTRPELKPLVEGDSYIEEIGKLPIVMAWIPGGEFDMGSENGFDDERPIHTVHLNGYWIGATEITQEQWVSVMGSNPSSKKNNKLPVNNISWLDVQNFINKVNNSTGRNYRLPTEAEWEYAALAKHKHHTLSGYVLALNPFEEAFASNSEDSMVSMISKLNPVMTFRPNYYGLYDMSWNCLEWCFDWYDPEYYDKAPQLNPGGPSAGTKRVIKGAIINDQFKKYARFSLRHAQLPTTKNPKIGFRLALSTHQVNLTDDTFDKMSSSNVLTNSSKLRRSSRRRKPTVEYIKKDFHFFVYDRYYEFKIGKTKVKLELSSKKIPSLQLSQTSFWKSFTNLVGVNISKEPEVGWKEFIFKDKKYIIEWSKEPFDHPKYKAVLKVSVGKVLE